MVRDAWLPLICSVLACFLVWWGAGHTQWGTKTASPTDTVKRLVASISGQPSLAATIDTAQATSIAPHHALAIIDLPGVCRQTLGKHWPKRNTAEKDEFIALFAQLLTHIAFPQSAAFFRDLDFTVEDERIQGRKAIVSTHVEHITEGQIGIDYRLIRQNGAWLIRDIQLDGVSLSRNLRAQFQQIIRQHSYGELIRRMREKLDHAMSASS